MTNVKRCIQCGLLKPEDDFRPYTYAAKNNTKGRYRICKTCEAINQAYRRAKLAEQNCEDDDAYWDASQEVKRIEKLYDVLASRGLRVPNRKFESQEAKQVDDVERLMAFYETQPTTTSPLPSAVAPAVPADLQEWLDVPMETWLEQGISPEYLQETIYESLKSKYRPMLRVDKDTFLPVYDDTYKDILNMILQRFDEYEESFQGRDIE